MPLKTERDHTLADRPDGRDEREGGADPSRVRTRLKRLESERQARQRLQARPVAGHEVPTSEPCGAFAPIVNGVYLGERCGSSDRQLEILRRVVALASGEMALRGANTGLPNGFGIERLYVPPTTDLSLPDWPDASALAAAGWLAVPEDGAGAHPVRARRLTALEAISLRRSQAIVGAPGAGKSVLLDFVAHALATGDRDALPDWPESEWNSLPVLLRLRDLAAWVAAQPSGIHASGSLVWGFIGYDLAGRNLTFCLDTLRAAVSEGRAVMLWDGLDEIPAPVLPLVQDSLLDFRRRAPRCRYVVTSRMPPYGEPDRRLPESDFPVAKLLPFDAERIDRFVLDWFAEVVSCARLVEAEAELQADAFREALRGARASSLAGNPLHLALMALVYSHRGIVPESRARLFEASVEVLLTRMDAGGARVGEVLRELRPTGFEFPHRTFREYLAGCRLAHSAGFAQEAGELADERAQWREPILHGAGLLTHDRSDIDRSIELVERLCSGMSNPDDAGWRRIWLAGEVALELGASRARDSERGVRAIERVRNRLAALVESGRLHPEERAAAASVLGRLGDVRFRCRGFRLPIRYRGEREKPLGLVSVKPGSFPMGSPDAADGVSPDELGNPGPVRLSYRFRISRYPVTVDQFRVFVDACGYERQEWWTRLGWAWCQGQPRRAPEDWTAQTAEPNRPVVGVTWYEAEAFARWLDRSMRESKTAMPTGYGLRLPTEAEWELAARGPEGRRYPWGDRFQDGFANVRGCLGCPSPVGLYSQGATPEGVHDLAGNVWEWTLSQDRPYPYRPRDRRNDPDAEAPRILRGGSFAEDPVRARALARARAAMEAAAGDIGFRLVLSLCDSRVAKEDPGPSRLECPVQSPPLDRLECREGLQPGLGEVHQGPGVVEAQAQPGRAQDGLGGDPGLVDVFVG